MRNRFINDSIPSVMREFAKLYAENTILKSINDLSENRPLYKDSGLWQVRTDDMEDVLFQQGVNEKFEDFIDRVNKFNECKHAFRHGSDDGNIYCNDCDIFLGKLKDV
jgi:hypothetical protein